MTTRVRIPLAVVAALALALPSAPLAQEAQDSPSGEILFGPNWYVDEADQRNSAKFGEYRDVPNSFVLERLLFSWTPRAGFYFDLDAYDVTQDDMRLRVQTGKTDLWKGTVTWQENPRRWTDQAEMLWTDSGGGVFTLDDAFQSAVEAAPASVDVAPGPPDGFWDAGTKGALIKSAIGSSADDVDVGHQRRTGKVAFQWTPTRSLAFGISGQSERRNGTTPQSLGMYFSLGPGEVAAPLDYRTDTGTLSASYVRRKFNVGAEFAVSKFETGYKSLTWDDQLFLNDTPAGANANPARGRLTLGTDNDLTRFSVYGGVNLPGHTRINVSATRSETTQDDAFLPMTTNTLLTPSLSALPADSFDGKYENNLVDLRVNSRPLRWFRWGAWGRNYEYKNESPSLTFAEYVQTDFAIPLCSNANSCGATTNTMQRRNLPFGYERTNLGALAGFKPFRWWDIAISYELESTERQHSAVEESDEDIVKLVMDFDVSDWLNIRTSARRQERRADEYQAHYYEESFPIGEPYVAAFNEGMRRFYWTDRDRDHYSLGVDITPSEKYSVYAEAIHIEDTYLDPETGREIGDSFTVSEDRNFDTIPETYSLLLAGRTGDEIDSYTLGASFTPVPRFNAWADYTWERSQYGLETRYRAPAAGIGSDNPLDDWGSDMDDRYKTGSVGFEWQLTAKGAWKISGDFTRSKGTGTIDTHFTPGGSASGNTTLTEFPELRTIFDIGRLNLTHFVNRSFDYTFRYWFESWQEDNFASDFMQPYMGDPTNDAGSSNAAFLGMDFKNYKNHILSFLMRCRFD